MIPLATVRSELQSDALLPLTRIVPPLGRTIPDITLRKVDLPAPFGPTIATFLPAGTVRETPWSTTERS
jgi:hypothetical protein